MGRTKSIDDVIELALVEAQVIKHLREVFRREFAIEPMDQRNALLAGDVPVPDFLRGFVGATANTELDEARPVVEPVNLVVDAVVFGISPSDIEA